MKPRPIGLSSQRPSKLPFGSKTILVGTGGMILYGLSRRSKLTIALATAGGMFALTVVKSQSEASKSSKATFLVNASPERAYEMWRNFENLPRFMAHLKSVRVDGQQSEWTARGLLSREFSWKAEITEDRPNQRISWHALPGSKIMTGGFVEFRPDPRNRGTFVTAEVQYSVPAGLIGTGIANFLGKNPEFMIREDLRRFKALLEAGEVPTTAGQTHGPRGLHGHVEQVLFRETSNHPEPQPAASSLPKSA